LRLGFHNLKTNNYEIKETNVIQLPVYPFKNGNIREAEGLFEMLNRFTKRLRVSYSGSSTAINYRNALRYFSLFNGCLVDQVETDEILDYLHYLKEKELRLFLIKYFQVDKNKAMKLCRLNLYKASINLHFLFKDKPL
jgi:hypothetical protein